MKREFKYEIDSSSDWLVKILIKNEDAISSNYAKIMMILVEAAKLMVGESPILGYSYHSFYLEQKGLTIMIEDHTRYRLKNAEKIAKHLDKVYKVIMSHYGCGNGLKRN